MSAFKTLDDGDFSGKRVLIRVDLNVPMEAGKITDTTRIERVLPTLRELISKGGKVIILAHFGRPKGGPDHENSLKPLASILGRLLNKTVTFASDCMGEPAQKAVAALQNGDVLLLENTRFHKSEETNDPAFVAELAKLGDVYVNDAFSAAHRAHASTEGIAHHMPAFAGRAMQGELEALHKALGAPKKPVVAVIGGAKVSTKLDLLKNLVAKVEALVIGGGMANTFLYAQGIAIGKSLCEKDMAPTVREIMSRAEAARCAIVLPIDAKVAYHFASGAPSHDYGIDAIPEEGMILDLGQRSIARIQSVIDEAQTVIWNGPLGAFELKGFEQTTVSVAQHVAARTRAQKLVSVGGGGDTVAALNLANVADDFSYVSTAGGAFLEWMEGKSLPGVDALKPKA